MPVNGLNVGVDYSFGLYDQNTKALVDLGDIQSIDIKANKHDVVSRPYNDVPKFGHVPDGYSGSFQIVRTSPEIEDLQIVLQDRFNAGTPIKAGYLNETTTSPDGSKRRYQYTGVDFFMDGVASVSREKTVTQSVVFMASKKVRVA